ncbi:MAG: Holliday junction resolvase RecU [Defluviitaleaceae bacterium]|nr:Holliday junction resolvase RecU [Defluviitaleaceae bacterium]
MSFANRGLRGSTFEEMINLTNERYRANSLAIVHKVATPITPVAIDKESRHITLAYFEKKSTVDYIGAVQGIPICFDAKETKLKNLPVGNMHRHQIEFMEDFTRQKGVAFVLVHFLLYDQYFFMPFIRLKEFWDTAQGGGRKSIPYEDFDKKYLVECRGGFLLYLDAINTYLESM